MNSYINGILKFIRNKDKYHQIAMILSLLILVILFLFQLSKIQDNRKLLINAKSDHAYVEEKFNLIANKISLNQLINDSESTNSLISLIPIINSSFLSSYQEGGVTQINQLLNSLKKESQLIRKPIAGW